MPVRHWARDPALRSWPVLLLVALVCVPPIALVMLNNPTEAKIRDIAWIFAAYFAVAWLLLLGVIVRPQHVSRAMLAAVAVVGIVTQAPIAIFLETQLHAGTGSLLDVFTIGVPEELAKAIPIVVVAWIWRRYWHTQTPRDYLFLGAVSGLVFGAAEVVHYFTNVLGSLSGNATGLDLQALTHPVRLALPHRPDRPRHAGPASPGTSSAWPSPARTGSTRSAWSGSPSRPSCTASTTGTRSTATPPGSWSR